MIEKLRKNRFLFEELVKRDFKKKYKRTMLGMMWSVMAPLLQLCVMALVFSKFFGRTQSHFVVYVFSGSLVFSFFSDATNGGMRSLMANAAIFSKVDVPKYIFLLSRNIQAVINFFLTLIIYFVFVVIDKGLHFHWKFFMLLYPIFFLVLFNIGVGMVLSALFVFFRDVEYLYGVLLTMLNYLSAIFYPVTIFSEKAQMRFYFNPVYSFISYFRKIVINNELPSPQLHGLIALYALGALLIGCVVYKKYNYKFLYYI